MRTTYLVRFYNISRNLSLKSCWDISVFCSIHGMHHKKQVTCIICQYQHAKKIHFNDDHTFKGIRYNNTLNNKHSTIINKYFNIINKIQEYHIMDRLHRALIIIFSP
jgi:hypothetical protein